MSAEDIIRDYGAGYDQLRLETASLAEQLWLELGGPDDERAKLAGDAIEELVNDANVATGQLVEQYVDDYVAAVSRQPPPAGNAIDNAIDVAELTIDQLRGLPKGTPVYSRNAIGIRKALADGKSWDQAMLEQSRRVNAMSQADTALAHRAAGRHAMQRHDLDYYRRVLTGASCDLCRVASTQRYRTGDLMPIHSRCDCRVAPLVDGYDGGRIVNRDLYRELKADGTLDRLNRSNRGTTGQSRARRAARNRERRLRQSSLDGTQGALDLPPVDAPAVRTHGELGPVLVNERHAFTAASSSADVVDDAGDLRRRAPDVDVDRPPAASTVDVPDEVVPDRPPRSGRWTVDTPSVQRAAIRRNVDPEVIIDELELKRADRLAEQRAERELRAQLTDVGSDEVRKLADAYDVTPDEIVAQMPKVPNARRVMADAAARVHLDAFEELDHFDALKVARPPRGQRPPEFDWLEGLHPDEQKRLRRTWMDADAKVYNPDLVAQRISIARGGADLSTDEAMEIWLRETRRADAAGAVRRGKLPAVDAYSRSSAANVDDLLEGYLPADELAIRPSEVVGVWDGDVAGRLAQLARASDEAAALGDQLDAERYLDDAIRGATGDPPPWRMSFQRWEEEVRELEYGMRNDPASLRPDFEARYRELVPEYLDEPGTSFEELYARTIDTSRRAGLDVADYARIPWENVDLDDVIDDALRRAEEAELAATRAAARRAEAEAKRVARFNDEAREAFDELIRDAETFEELAAAADNLDLTAGRRQVARFDDAVDVDDVVRRWDERHPTTFTAGRLSTDEAVEVAATLEELEERFPLLAGHDLVEVGELNAVIGARNIPGIGIAGMATHPGIRLVDNGGAIVALPRSGAAKLGVRPGMVHNVQEVGDNAATYFSTSNPRTLTVHEYGHQLGFSAEVELFNRYLAGELDYPGRRPRTPNYDRDMSALVDAEVKTILRDVIPDAPVAAGKTVGTLPKNAAFGKFVPAIAAELSEYGATNARELIAESFAEVALEGPNARPLARAITDRVLELIEAGNTRIKDIDA